MIASVAAAFAIATILSSNFALTPVLTDAALNGLNTSIKNLSKDKSPTLIWASLSTTAAVAMVWQSLFPLDVKVGSLALSLLMKHALRSIEEYQLGDAADEDGEDQLVDGQIKSDGRPPAAMWKQFLMTGTAIAGACTSQIFSDYLSPIVPAALSKASSRFFSNIMRQLPYKLSAPITGLTAATLLGAGGTLLGVSDNTLRTVTDLGNVALGLGTSVPFGEIKTWQLGKKIAVEKEPAKDSEIAC